MKNLKNKNLAGNGRSVDSSSHSSVPAANFGEDEIMEKINWSEIEIHGNVHAYEKQWRDCTEEEFTNAINESEKSETEIMETLSNGQELPFAETNNYYFTHDMMRIRIKREVPPEPELVKCDCGHSVPKISVMHGFQTMCSDCYGETDY